MFRTMSGVLSQCERVPSPTAWSLGIETTAINQDFSVTLTGTQAIVIDWGDGNSDTYTTNGTKVHTYADAGVYTLQISGSLTGGSANIRFDNSATVHRLKTAGKIWGITGLASAYYMFKGCTGLTSIPSNIFDRFSFTSSPFEGTFYGSGLTAIPAGLFNRQTGITTYAFMSTFRDCLGLTAIPAGLFDKQTGITFYSFTSAFRGCKNITAIPVGLFDSQKATARSFDYTFQGCSGLTGAAPELWDIAQWTQVATGATCFGSAVNLSNYSSIPTPWK